MSIKSNKLLRPQLLGNHTIQLCLNRESLILLKKANPELSFIEMEQPHLSEFKYLNTTTTSLIKGVDALISKREDIALVVRSADCLPILISTSTGYFAAIHAGRKSTELNISKKTSQFLSKQTHKATIFLGPHICKTCYEVEPNTHKTFDLASENKKQICLKSVTYVNSFSCTYCSQDTLFFSHRRGSKERFFSVIAKHLKYPTV